MTTGDRIREARQKKGLSQEQLGALIGVQKAAIHKYENNIVINLKRDTIEKLAGVLGVSPAHLMGFEDELPAPAAQDDGLDEELRAFIEKLKGLDAETLLAIEKIVDSILAQRGQ